MLREPTFLDKLGGGRGIIVILKGQYVGKTRAAQEDKNDTQQGILNKNRPNLLADYYEFNESKL